MNENNIAKEYCELFKVLAHPIRLKIACGLSKKDECNVNFMTEQLGISQSNVSQHLAIMRSAGILTRYQKGTQACYRLTNEKVKKIIKVMEVDLCK